MACRSDLQCFTACSGALCELHRGDGLVPDWSTARDDVASDGSHEKTHQDKKCVHDPAVRSSIEFFASCVLRVYSNILEFVANLLDQSGVCRVLMSCIRMLFKVAWCH